jgi:hypothetical protein
MGGGGGGARTVSKTTVEYVSVHCLGILKLFYRKGTYTVYDPVLKYCKALHKSDL